MKKIIILLAIIIVAAASCRKKQEAPLVKKDNGADTEQAVSAVSEKDKQQRQVLSEKLKNPALGLHAYDPFTIRYEDFELKNLSGNPVKLSSYAGQVIFLNFWATWCGPCRAEMPAMETIYREYKDRGLVILAVNLQEDTNSVAAFVKEYELTFPVVIDTTGTTGSVYGARSIPMTYLFDRKGYAVTGSVGSMEWDGEEYREVLELLLRENG